MINTHQIKLILIGIHTPEGGARTGISSYDQRPNTTREVGKGSFKCVAFRLRQKWELATWRCYSILIRFSTANTFKTPNMCQTQWWASEDRGESKTYHIIPTCPGMFFYSNVGQTLVFHFLSLECFSPDYPHGLFSHLFQVLT